MEFPVTGYTKHLAFNPTVGIGLEIAFVVFLCFSVEFVPGNVEKPKNGQRTHWCLPEKFACQDHSVKFACQERQAIKLRWRLRSIQSAIA